MTLLSLPPLGCLYNLLPNVSPFHHGTECICKKTTDSYLQKLCHWGKNSGLEKHLSLVLPYLPFSRCRSPQFPAPASGTESLKCIEGRTSRRSTCQMFTPHLNLARSDPLAELAQRRPCFVHVAEQQEALPDDVLLLQGFLRLLAQGRRVGHVLVVLRDLPTQDHVAAIIHLGVRRGLAGSACSRCKARSLIICDSEPTCASSSADLGRRREQRTNRAETDRAVAAPERSQYR